ncbi:probable ATP-dependent RNA helicase DDX31 [Aplysia californica]|uniref:ATP-dependent RNA helicase n=1 Tax=Aplysia californica TaxID=6500 RepID=A0ABM1A7R5_APLCA|nr:probable ATP-dependent RNA helicase DDX31 [Aplysia californica]
MDDFSGEISLNLVSDDVSNFPSRKKIHGDRASRVKQRKESRLDREKNQGGHLLSSSASGDNRGNLKRKQLSSNDDGKNDGIETFKKRKGDSIISSLFRKNPEIPNITGSEVDGLSEKVFTGKTFKDLPIHPYLVSNLEEKHGFHEMTEIQRRAIPVLLRRKDALIKSQTGSGKTLSYAVPIIQSLQSRKIRVQRNDGPYAVVIVPTRELALQSYDIFLKLLRTFIWIVPGCLMGGEKRKAEKSRLRKGVNILVSTPGRLLDHINATSVLSLRRVQWLVIDEADRLLELGYERDIAQILNALKAQCPDPPQTVLLSATLSEGVERLSSISLNEPERVSVTDAQASRQSFPASDDTTSSSRAINSDASEEGGAEAFAVPSRLSQHFVVTPCKLRLVTLASLILWKCQFTKPGSKMVVFLSTQDSVEFHSRLFSSVLASSPKDTVGKLQAMAMGEVEDVGDSDDDDDDDDSEVDGDEKKKKSSKGKLKIFQLHGEMSQKDRSRTFSEFSQTTTGVLLCTDVAARGLDLPHVDWIVQYTSPGSTVDYVHRVGRTARAGTQGHSLLFLMPSEAGYIQELNRHKISLSQLQPGTITQHLLSHLEELPSPDADTKRQKPVTQEEAATYLQDRFEESVLRDAELRGLAGRGFQSYIRGYATYSKEVKEYFRVSELHFGHVAKSFALREAPGKVSGVAAKVTRKTWNRQEKPKKKPLSFKQAMLNEYSSGLQKGQQTKVATGRQLKQKKKKKLMR